MREKASDVKAERDALRREADVLREALRALTATGAETFDVYGRSEERSYVDATAGSARMVATLLNPRRAHGGIALVETHYSGRRDVEVILLDAWRSRVSRMIESGCSSAWLFVELDLITKLTRKVESLVA